MEICSCWEERKLATAQSEGPIIYNKTIQICNGTKEREECSCNGDESKCNFYPEKRKEKQVMNIAEMWLKAQKDGKTYKSYDMFYNKKLGFHDKNRNRWPGHAFERIDDIFEANTWELRPDNEMTKAEAEEKFSIKIID